MNLTKLLFIALIFSSFYQSLWSQNSTAVDIYTTYQKIGFRLGYNSFTPAKITGADYNQSAYFTFDKGLDFSLGLDYNFYQVKNWNFKASFLIQKFGERSTLFLDANEFYNDSNLIEKIDDVPTYVYQLPLSLEYIKPLGKRIAISVGSGFSLSYYPYSYPTEYFFAEYGEYFYSIYQSNEKPLYVGAKISSTQYFTFKGFLLQTNIFYSKSFKSYRTGTYKFTNLQESPDFGGTIDQSGDYLGFSLSIHFRKKAKE